MERRTFLAMGAGTLGLVGCTNGSGASHGEADTPASPESPDSDAGLRQTAAATEVSLIMAYHAAIAAAPDHAVELRAFRAHHGEHLARMAPDRAVPEASEAAGMNPPAVADLAGMEARARKQHVTGCDAARDAALARELCLMGASEAQHAWLLRELDRQPGKTAR